MPAPQSLPLRILLHGVPAMEFEANPGLPEFFRPGSAAARVSVAWDQAPDINAARAWLSGCLQENGALSAFVSHARAELARAGERADSTRDPETLFWGNPDTEYPGAVSAVRSTGSLPSAGKLSEYGRLDDRTLSAILRYAVESAAKGSRRPSETPAARASLSGVRPKTSLSLDAKGKWCQGRPGQPNTWVVKIEDARDNPGEAGVEAVSQRAFRLVGVPASRTFARVLGGYQCVLSERSDRQVDEAGLVQPVHQEDFAQASGWAVDKYPLGIRGEPLWPAAYRILREHAIDPDAECDKLTRFLACTWLLRHADLHRKNLGFVHSGIDSSKSVSLAPAYDVSSSVGTEYSDLLAIGIAGQSKTPGIGEPQWRAHARECGIDVESTIEAVRRTAEAMPDAFSQACSEAREEDENREQYSVDRRLAETAKHIVKRAAHFRRTLDKRARRLSKRSTQIP